MDIQAHRSNTVKVKIPHGKVHDAIKDVRKWRIRHLPHRRVYGGLEMELYANPKIDLLLIKYG